MDHGVEVILEVDAFAQAIGANQHALGGLRELSDSFLPFRRGQQAGDGDYLHVLEFVTQGSGYVLGRRDEAAEQDGVKAVAEQALDEGYDLLELGVLAALE